MEVYELKFKKKQLQITCGISYDILGLFWLILTIIYFLMIKSKLSVYTVLTTTLTLLTTILCFYLGNYYITLSSRTYVKICDKELEIYKGLVRKNQIIKFKDIEKVCFIGEKIVIILMNYCSNKEIEIMLNAMNLKDLDILLDNFSKNNILVKRL